MCLHGSAKSLIAAEHFNRLAAERQLGVRAESAGLEPDDGVPQPVVAGLAASGIDVREYVPARVTSQRLAAASHVVSFGCDLPSEIRAAGVERWDDVPMVSDGFTRARDEIIARVTLLLDRFG